MSATQLSASDVAEMFSNAIKRGPMPSEPQCQRLAQIINEGPLLTLPEAPNRTRSNKKIQQMLVEILHIVDNRIDELTQLTSQLSLDAPLYRRDFLVVETRNFRRLKEGIHGVLRHFAGSRDHEQARAHWHRLGLYVAYHAEAVLEAAGRRVGRGPHSPLVKFVISVLNHLGVTVEPGAVASMLGRALYTQSTKAK